MAGEQTFTAPLAANRGTHGGRRWRPDRGSHLRSRFEDGARNKNLPDPKGKGELAVTVGFKKNSGVVQSIDGSASRVDVVTQQDLSAALDLHDACWAAMRLAQKAAITIESRIAAGAIVQTGDLTFDKRRKMVRDRRRKDGDDQALFAMAFK